MTEASRQLDDYALVERAISCLVAQPPVRPGYLAALASELGLGEAATRDLLLRWAGISAQRFGQLLGADDVRRRIASTAGQLGGTDLSGPDRPQAQGVVLDALSPDGLRRASSGMRLTWGLGDTPFGAALLVLAPPGICHLAFVDASAPEGLGDMLVARWPQARLRRDDPAAAGCLRQLFLQPPRPEQAPRLWVAGSEFQIAVWRALLRVPHGGLLSYGRLAALLGRPRAARAVGSAVARNPVAWLIPCHRVVRENGDFGHYHWGQRRKQAICAWEAASGPGP